jgi:hypothetical protein
MNAQSSTFTRRDALKLGAAAAIGCLAGANLRAADEAASEPSINVFSDYAWLRGFSVVPSWGARIEEAWWNYDGSRFREEVALAKEVHANCIRLWIEFTAWMADPDKVTERFFDAVAAIDEMGMKTMPCLFNRWHDEKWDYGGLYIDDLYRDYPPRLDYVRTLVKPLADDPRILVWDLCNEPNAMNLDEKWSQYELKFLTEVAATVRQCRVKQPIMIGTQHTTNIEIYAPLCDVLGYHPYMLSPAELKSQIEGTRAIGEKFGKPVLVNESMPGCLDDNRRAELVKYYTAMLSEAGFGWMGWALREGKAVSTRRDRYDYNGIDREGYHPYFTAKGKLRGGLDFLRETPKILPPWKRTTKVKNA